MRIRITIDYDAVEDPNGERPKGKMLSDILAELSDSLTQRELHQWDSGDIDLTYCGSAIGHWYVE